MVIYRTRVHVSMSPAKMTPYSAALLAHVQGLAEDPPFAIDSIETHNPSTQSRIPTSKSSEDPANRHFCCQVENQLPLCIHSQKMPGSPNENQLAKAAETRPNKLLKTGMDSEITMPIPQIPRVMRSQEIVDTRVLLTRCLVLPKIRVNTY